MARFVPVTPDNHSGKRWLRFSNFTFAAQESFAPLVVAELANIAAAMPCAFIEQAGHYVFVALLSLTPRHNAFVGPAAQWLGSYLPSGFRFYPFRMLRAQNSGQLLLCVDEDSGLITNDVKTGEPFFDESGQPAPVLQGIFDALMQVERSRQLTESAVATLAEARVIQPWPLKVKTDQGERPIDGLHRIDETALGALSDDAFLRLRKVPALAIAYAQLLSIGQLAIFQYLERLRQQPTSPVPALPETLDSLLENLNVEGFRLS